MYLPPNRLFMKNPSLYQLIPGPELTSDQLHPVLDAFLHQDLQWVLRHSFYFDLQGRFLEVWRDL